MSVRCVTPSSSGQEEKLYIKSLVVARVGLCASASAVETEEGVAAAEPDQTEEGVAATEPNKTDEVVVVTCRSACFI